MLRITKVIKRILSWGIALLLMVSECSLASVAKSYDAKQQAYQQAIGSNDIDVLNEFIREYQYTGWDENASWYRDKLLLEIAKKNGSVGAINAFLATYPNSSWYNHAVHFRDKSAYRQARLINTLEVYDDFLNKYPGSQWQEKVEKLRKKLVNLALNKTKSRKVKKFQPELLSTIKTDKPESAEVRRNQAALAIYDGIRQKKKKEKQAKLEKKEKRLALKRYCHRVKDQLRRIDEGRRWYRLDDQGERYFLSDAQIDASRQKLINNNIEKCEFRAG